MKFACVGSITSAVSSYGLPVTVAGSPVRLWRTYLDDACRPYPGSHTINGVEIVPAAVYLQTFLTATGARLLCGAHARLPSTV